MALAAHGGPVPYDKDWAVFHVGDRIRCPVHGRNRGTSKQQCGRVLGEVKSGMVYVANADLQAPSHISSWPSHTRICPGCNTMLDFRMDRRTENRE